MRAPEIARLGEDQIDAGAGVLSRAFHSPMTKREAVRRLQHLALEAGRKRNYYVKRALVEFLDRNEHLLEYKPTHRSGLPTLNNVSSRFARAPEFAQLFREG